ncbi:MAG: DUF2292 domain-containing protein [Oscillospiraceae bacterium]|nr:DUF2292 domain-containing protein [Oscillospiraceae bacterium]
MPGGAKKWPPEAETELPLTARERELLTMLRQMEYGEIQIKVEHGVPTAIEELRRSIILDQ